VITLSVIIATLGRPTLTRMLDSIARQDLIVGNAGDEVLVVGDGPQPSAAKCVKSINQECFGQPFRYLEGPLDHCFGNTQRNFGIRHARGDYIVFQDDDNVMLPGAFRAMRGAAEQFCGRPVIFKVRFLNGQIAPSGPRLVCGDFDTACGAWPNMLGKLGGWGRSYEGDYLFARDTLALYDLGEAEAIWRPEVIAAHRPHLMPPAEFKKFFRT
jgi:glycosyltransferase involved in cell wall biosynthesis